MNQPLLSVVVLSYKRREELKQTVASVLAQEYDDYEVIVVDNNSGDGTAEAIEESFPEVRVISLSENIGTAARNVGINAARGEIVVTLDNDVILSSRLELESIRGTFEGTDRLCCTTFKMLYTRDRGLSKRDWFHPFPPDTHSDARFPTYYINEGAAAFRRSMLSSMGMYDQTLFLGHEGLDLAFRILDEGYEIEYTPNVVVLHNISEETRTSWRLLYYNTRNYLIIARRYCRWRLIVQFLLPRIIAHGVYAFRTRHLRAYFSGLFNGIRTSLKGDQRRSPMKRSTERMILNLASNKPGFLAWVRRHREKPLF